MVSTTQVETQLQDIADRIDEIVTILKEMRGATKEIEERVEEARDWRCERSFSIAQN
jgi:chaperonin cofactor prefoldin